MNDLVIFPDAARLIVDYLRDELGNVPVGTRIPNPRPTSFVTVQRGGGIRQTVISDNPLLLIECWNVESSVAHDLAQHCRGLLHTLPGTMLDDVAIYRVDEVAGPQELPDPISDQARYVFTVQIHLRGAVPAAS